MEKYFLVLIILPALLSAGFSILVQNNNEVERLVTTLRSLLGISALASLVSLAYVLQNQAMQVNFFTHYDLGFSFRIDEISMIMYFMVSVIGMVVVNFAKNYVAGEKGHLLFIKRLSYTILSVQILVTAGNLLLLFLAWIAISIALHYLLTFYKNRHLAILAARKKFVVSRLGDLFLLVGFALLYIEYGTGELNELFAQVRNEGLPLSLMGELSVLLLVLAAAIKSVQIPFHGWLLDVIEAPTPVSGLLHAGLLNAGPFLIIRFAMVTDMAVYGPTLLVILGGVTAIYGTVVFATQSSVKSALAYSSIGHMGFSLMVCGMGAFSASLLHLVAHSFYKAHSFLSSGSMVDKYRVKQFGTGLKGKHNSLMILLSLIVSGGAFYFIADWFIGWEKVSQQILFIGAIIVVSLSVFLSRVLSEKNTFAFLVKSLLSMLFVLTMFFSLESGIELLIHNQIPDQSTEKIGLVYTTNSLIIFFIMVALMPLLSDVVKLSFIEEKWRVYARNGFYIHHRFDKMIKNLM